LIVALVVVQTGFGGYGIVVKRFAQSANINPLVLSLLRDLCCFPLLFIAARIFEGFPRPKLIDIPLFFAQGLFLFLNQFLYLEGVYLTSPNIASIFQQSIPVLTAVIAIASCTEPPPPLTKVWK